MNKSYEKLFAVLSLYSMERTSLSINEIVEELGYPKSSVHRILNMLVKGDFIIKNPNNQRYSLGSQFFRLGSIYQSQLDLRTTALPTMQELAQVSTETIDLNVIQGLNRVCIEKIDSLLTVRRFIKVGESSPLHLGSSGKTLLAFLKDYEREKIVNQLEEKYKFNKQNLFISLNKIQNNGYVVTKDERVEGSFGVSAPILDMKDDLIGSITIVGPIQRLSSEKEREFTELILNGAKKISKQFGNFNIA